MLFVIFVVMLLLQCNLLDYFFLLNYIDTDVA